MRIDFFFTILLIFGLFSIPYLTFGEFPAYELTENDMEWCDEVFPLYEKLGLQWFLENHHYSIKARVCGSLYEDPIWEEAAGEDRLKKLQVRSNYYVELEIKESEEEAKVGIDDPTPVAISQPEVVDSVELVVEPKESEGKMEETIPEELPQKEEVPKNGGGCLIATATFDSELAPQVQQLRERDNTVLATESGSAFMELFNTIYYSFSPAIADLERQNPAFKETVKLAITPLVSSLAILNYLDIDSEAQVLGYGIGIIILNIGMYFVAPEFVIYRLQKKK